MYTLAELKPGRAVVFEGQPYLITWSQFSKQGRQGGVAATKMKNLKTGSVIQQTFQGSDKLEEADVGYRKVQYLYGDGNSFTFMDLNSYDQFALTSEMVGDAAEYLMEGLELDAMIFEENPIGIQLPATVELKVVETIPGVKGDTASGGNKPATLSSGLKVNVPLFINEGDIVKVNTVSGEYMGRM
ncbi:elongation factor P [Candidatus Peribacteria bacterium RIFOXYC2_FULL_55_14]|nr:MAG: elongation factor P [Candidatus Peribacteria bacterium RIFOXYA1_FULL_56_14]OGJ74404.1 MAG: elongation factor P [Candidatus Peribacteria bacterium RIFOXYB1_FULL_54_35]OGJ75270.1 MAG: elongation factor P [Candidatus Peribacteria bacterium RIFOXYA2_FULL_55_28]OGJ76023.1 MAG: elongation factor P [Candidatus Peribacteria bacterium RIFOXYB2_FULL_54_17]OGJ77513.1 MAG: elongation factor P [Candidatus Peribacteria bacterium RIFOXYC1_FULL_54_13]OGJ80618.1 MAG: elongation factor P [Candidatus Per